MSMNIRDLTPRNLQPLGVSIAATCVSVISMLLVTGPASFAQTTNPTTAETVRYAAIHKCVLEAQQQYPNVNMDEPGNARHLWYIACMQKAGQRP